MTIEAKPLLLAVVLGAGLLIAGGLFAATQYWADTFHYHPSLGRALIIRGTPCYPPWAWLSWQRRFPERATRVLAAAEATTCGGGLIAFMIILAVFESALAFSAGYGIKCFLICQSSNQLEKAYGRDNAIVDNCHVRMAEPDDDTPAIPPPPMDSPRIGRGAHRGCGEDAGVRMERAIRAAVRKRGGQPRP